MENFGSQISEVKFRKSKFRKSNFGSKNFGSQISEVKFRKSNFGSQISEVHFRKSIFGSQFSEVNFSEVHYFRNPFWELIFRANFPHLRELDRKIDEVRTVRNYSDLSAKWCTSHFRQQGRVKRNNLRRPERSLSTTSRTQLQHQAPAQRWQTLIRDCVFFGDTLLTSWFHERTNRRVE